MRFRRASGLLQIIGREEEQATDSLSGVDSNSSGRGLGSMDGQDAACSTAAVEG